MCTQDEEPLKYREEFVMTPRILALGVGGDKQFIRQCEDEVSELRKMSGALFKD